MAFLIPPEEIIYYLNDAQRTTITVGVTADSVVTPTVIVAMCNRREGGGETPLTNHAMLIIDNRTI